MGQVLYRKYRSKTLDEVVGQEHITTSLTHALKSGKVAHAYLFTGPRGVGKTSVARILAYAVNGLPYDESTQLDIIEIDAASNRRIDEIRDLRDKVSIAPTSAKYKVYIIDEVHMLTREAFNALLKTLEEPPEHVIFILATTEAYKLPETIISRTQRYSFKPVSKQKVIDHLATIAKNEKIKIDEEALDLIAEHGEGSFRDSISMLDQLRHSDQKISRESVESALGIAPKSAVIGLINDIVQSKRSNLIENLSGLYESGYQPSVLAKQLGEEIRNELIDNTNAMPYEMSLDLLRQLLDIPSSAYPDKLLELVLLDVQFKNRNGGVQRETPLKTVENEAPQITEPEPVSIQPSNASKPKNSVSKFDEKLWGDLLRTIKQKHNTLYSFLRMGRPEFSKDKLVLTFGFKFHQKRLDDAKNKQSIADTIFELTGKNVEITCLFVPGTTPYDAKSDNEEIIEDIEEANDPSLETINNIFGSSEVLES